MIDPGRAHLADHRIKKARERSHAVREKLASEAEAHRQSYERSYNQLVVVCGGTVALSITYLAYLDTSRASIAHGYLLLTSWIALLLCLVFSIFAPFVYSFYLTFSRQAEYAKRLAEQLEIEANELAYVQHLPVLSTVELSQTIAERQRRASGRERDSTWNSRRASAYWFIWRWGGLCARLCFATGITCLVLFAISNFRH